MNNKKNNSTTKYLFGGIIVLMLLLLAVRVGGNNPEDNSVPPVNTASVSSSEDTIENLTDSVVEVNSEPKDNSEEPYICPDGQPINESTDECPASGSTYSDSDVPNVGEEEEEGYGGSDGEINVTKLLFPCTEKQRTSDSYGKFLGEIDKINGHKKFCWITSFIQEEELTFSIGYMEGCPVGNVEKNSEACTDVNNWREEKRKISPENRTGLVGENYTNKGYYGSMIKSDDPEYKTDLFYTKIPEKPQEIEKLGSYHVTTGDIRTYKIITIEIKKDEAVIILN